MNRTLPLRWILLAAGLALTLPFCAAALEKGDKVFRFGPAYVSPNDDSSGVLGDNGIGLIPGNDGVTVDSAWALGLEFDWMFADRWSFSVLGTTPVKHDVDGAGALAGVNVGSIKHIPPTISVQYHFNPTGSVQPYLGAGLNYTYIYDEEASPALRSAIDGILGGSNTVSLDADDSFGVAAKFGIDFSLNDAWALNASLWYIDINTEVDVQVNGATAAVVDVDVNPWVVLLSAAYRF